MKNCQLMLALNTLIIIIIIIIIVKKSDGTENQRKNQDYTKHRTVEVPKNTEKSLRDLTRLAVAQSPVKKTAI